MRVANNECGIAPDFLVRSNVLETHTTPVGFQAYNFFKYSHLRYV